MAFAHSSWAPRPRFNGVSNQQPIRRTTMVMEKSFSPRRNNPQFESFDSLHDRLGIENLWSSDTPDAFDMRQTSTSDVLVVGDGSPSTKSIMPWDTTTGALGVSLLGRRMRFLRKRQQILAKSYEECRRITELFSKTFFLGTQLLSPEKRRAVWAVYTWCRRTDDIVDGPRVTQRSAALRNQLADWETRLDEIFDGGGRDGLDMALADAVGNYRDMTCTPFRDMIKGMLMDVDQARFDTFDDLYLYCYRVAGTVGLMTLPIMGTVKPGREGLREAMEAALALGIGLQLTNILRDVGEDRLRGRIYLPLEDLHRFNYTEEDLMNCVLDTRYKNLMKFEIARARKYFRKAQKGVHLLAEDSRLPVQASLDMYSQILDVLEENGFDNFNRRAYISKSRKLFTVPMSFLRTRDNPSWKPLLDVAEFVAGSKIYAP
uniref:15-cis-phytoene synthase n=1 Tax=Grateloupia catenata TaxID=118369 RepID=A0A2D2AGY6_9FLOR|nr:phytoene synthetase [Grateloupia catenata]